MGWKEVFLRLAARAYSQVAILTCQCSSSRKKPVSEGCRLAGQQVSDLSAPTGVYCLVLPFLDLADSSSLATVGETLGLGEVP